MDSLDKLILGTAQLGLAYGINNKGSKLTKEEAFEILSIAYAKGIRTLDTAEAYGDAADLIGRFHNLNPTRRFKVISKFSSSDVDVSISKHVEAAIGVLQINFLKGYLFHSYADYESNQSTLAELDELSKSGIIEMLGVSLYTAKEFESVLKDDRIRLVQIPYNLFDNRLLWKKMFIEAKRRGVVVHVRSIFLQGLFFRDTNTFPSTLKPLVAPIKQVKQIASSKKLDLGAICMQYAINQQEIDGVLFGVESCEQLCENITNLDNVIDESIYKEIEKIPLQDHSLLKPTNW